MGSKMLLMLLMHCVACLIPLVGSTVPLLADGLNGNVDDPTDFCFVSFGCWGGLNKATQKRVADVMGRKVAASSLPTTFVIAAGDNFYKKGVTSVHDGRFMTTFDQVYDHPSLKALPFLVALGNHDYRGNFFAQVNYTQYQLHNEPRSTGRWYLPEAYYVKQVHKHLVVFVLDTVLLERCANNGDASPRCWDHGAQRAFLESELERFKDVQWKVVVGHYPMHANGPHVNFPWLVSWLQPLLERHCVSLYINADNHYLQVSRANGVYYVNSGGGAGFGVRHLPTHKNYAKSPHSLFVAFEDGIFHHCVHAGNNTLTSTAVNHNGEERFHFASMRDSTCSKGVSDQQSMVSRGVKHYAAPDEHAVVVEKVVVDHITVATVAPRADVAFALLACGGIVAYAVFVWSRGSRTILGRKRP